MTLLPWPYRFRLHSCHCRPRPCPHLRRHQCPSLEHLQPLLLQWQQRQCGSSRLQSSLPPQPPCHQRNISLHFHSWRAGYLSPQPMAGIELLSDHRVGLEGPGREKCASMRAPLATEVCSCKAPSSAVVLPLARSSVRLLRYAHGADIAILKRGEVQSLFRVASSLCHLRSPSERQSKFNDQSIVHR
jgi:hypothetical protein